MRAAATERRLAAWAACLSLALPAAARAQSEVAAHLDVYGDGDILVVAPAASAHLETDGSVELDIAWMANVLSGATPLLTSDVVTSATTFQETRHSIDATVQGATGALGTVSGGGKLSLESDYLVGAATVGGQREVGHRMVVLSGSYTTLWERAWVVHRDGTFQSSVTHRGDLGATVILSRSARLSVAASGIAHACGALQGCQANPYRYVVIESPGGGFVAARERHPDRRARLAARVGLDVALGRHAAVGGGYRFYGDSWSVIGHTGDLGLSFAAFEERLMLHLDGRLSWQEPASFYRVSHRLVDSVLPGLRTGDVELGSVRSARIGGRVEWALRGLPNVLRFAVSMRLHYTHYRYPDSPWHPRRDAWVGGLGVQVER